MSLAGQLETEIEIKTPAATFHHVFSHKPHHVSTMSPGHIQAADLHEGEWGKVGTIVSWTYMHDGVQETAKELVEVIDDTNYIRTFKVLEGHLFEKYDEFHVTVQAIPKGEGSLVRWTLKYVKKSAEVPEPHGIIKLVENMTKDIDAHHTQKA